ncbi:MAG: diiron oxygenase [Aeromicrobium sp.]
MTTTVDREVVAQRLLGGAIKRSYQPEVDIDWDAPIDPEKYFLPPPVVSLYRTPLWEEMTEEQRIELSRQEMANVLSVGIWFENVLNRALLNELTREDPRSAHSHYTLNEMGDECRHMTMFGKVIDRVGARPYGLRMRERLAIQLLPFALRGSLLWVAALVGEEIFDALQRRMMDDPLLQPLVSQLMRIHVTEEARHIKFAREGVVRRMESAGRLERILTGNLVGLGGPVFRYAFSNPAVYRRAGLDVERASREAAENPNLRAAQVTGFAPLAQFLTDNGLLGPIGRRLWRRAGFLP